MTRDEYVLQQDIMFSMYVISLFLSGTQFLVLILPQSYPEHLQFLFPRSEISHLSGYVI